MEYGWSWLTGLTWQWAWAFVLLPLPWLYRRVLPPARRQTAALYIPFAGDYVLQENEQLARGAVRHRNWQLALAWLAWALLVAAAARPVWVGEAMQLSLSGRDLMMAVDLSGSMQIQDFMLHGQTVDRLTATKAVAGDFIRRRKGDRIGLILFGSRAYVQAPLTFDVTTVNTLLQESAIGLAGRETAIGDAMGLALKRMTQQKDTQKVLILLTDGVNTAGELKPLEVADIAAQKGIRIYTIGIGASEMLVPSLFGSRRINPSRDLDEGTLQAIAERTGGKYFRAMDTAQFERIYQQIDQLEPLERDQRLFRPVHALYVWPLSLAMALALLVFWLRQRT